MPHLARDPVMAAAAIVQALPPLIAQETDPADSAVLGVTRMSTGVHIQDVIVMCTLKLYSWTAGRSAASMLCAP